MCVLFFPMPIFYVVNTIETGAVLMANEIVVWP